MEGRTRSRDRQHWDRIIRDVSCPGDFREEFVVTDPQDAERVQRAAQVGGDLYSWLAEGRWLRSPGGAAPEPVPDCLGAGPIVPGWGSLFGNLQEIQLNAKVTREADEVTVDGAVCHRWTVAGAALGRSFVITIADADHLPRRLELGNDAGDMTFSAWNATIVQAPAGTQ